MQHLTLGEEIVFDKMIALKKDLSTLLKSQNSGNAKISYLPLLIKAASLSLKRHPALNATVNKEATEMVLHHNHNIGVAMDTPKGLIVPVIERVQDKSIFEIASDLAKLQVFQMNSSVLTNLLREFICHISYLSSQADAISGNISEKQLRGGTFSLSNIGKLQFIFFYI